MPISTVPASWPCGAARVRARPGRRFRAALLALLLTGCDYPTASPQWYTEWLVPVKTTRLMPTQLLPATVSAVADGSAFQVAVAPTTLARSLGQLCSACGAFSGQNVPKPAFTATLADTLDLPASVSSAGLVGGTVSVAITNGFSFDPLRPSATARGSLTVTLTSGTTTVGTLTISGTDTALPAGTTLTRDVALSNGTVTGGLVATLTLTSPAGDVVRVDPSQSFSVTVTPQPIRVTSVSVVVSQKTVSVQEATLDLSDVDQALIDRVHGGTLVVTVDNPYTVAGPLSLTISGGGLTSPLTKALNLTAGRSTQRIDFTLPEIKSMLGHAGLLVRATGTVSAPAPVPVTPWQSVGITTELDLIVGPKEK